MCSCAGWGGWSCVPGEIWTGTPPCSWGRLCQECRRSLWLWLMENYNNPMHAGFLMALRLEQWRFGSSYRVMSPDHLGARWRQREHRVNGWRSYNQVTSDRNEDRSVLSVCSLFCFKYACLSPRPSVCQQQQPTMHIFLYLFLSSLIPCH